MGDGGQYQFQALSDQILAHYRPLVRAAPGDVTTRYLLLPDFPFKTAQLLFDVTADDGAGDSSKIVVAPVSKGPLEDEDILAEILCRLPPLPSPHARASLVSRRWARIGASAAFRRGVRKRHGKPPVLGVYEKQGRTLLFIPALEAPDAIAPGRLSLKVVSDQGTENWNVLGCRLGRVLLVNRTRPELMVFDPVSGERYLVDFPLDFMEQACSINGAVVVDERQDQSPSPSFKVVLVGVSEDGSVAGAVDARVYDSQTGAWGDLVSTPQPGRVGRLPCTLVGDVLHWWLAEPVGKIIQFDMVSQKFAMIKRPPVADINIGCSRIIRGEDGGIGLAVLSYPAFRLYDRKVDPHGLTTWPLQKIVQMNHMLDLPDWMAQGTIYIVGYTEDADAVVMSVHHRGRTYLYIIHIDSMQHKRLDGQFMENAYYPFAHFYTAGPSALQFPACVDNDGSTAVAEDVDNSTQELD